MFKIEYNVNTLGLAEIGTESLLWPDKGEFLVYIKVKQAGVQGTAVANCSKNSQHQRLSVGNCQML